MCGWQRSGNRGKQWTVSHIDVFIQQINCSMMVSSFKVLTTQGGDHFHFISFFSLTVLAMPIWVAFSYDDALNTLSLTSNSERFRTFIAFGFASQNTYRLAISYWYLQSRHRTLVPTAMGLVLTRTRRHLGSVLKPLRLGLSDST